MSLVTSGSRFVEFTGVVVETNSVLVNLSRFKKVLQVHQFTIPRFEMPSFIFAKTQNLCDISWNTRIQSIKEDTLQHEIRYFDFPVTSVIMERYGQYAQVKINNNSVPILWHAHCSERNINEQLLRPENISNAASFFENTLRLIARN